MALLRHIILHPYRRLSAHDIIAICSTSLQQPEEVACPGADTVFIYMPKEDAGVAFTRDGRGDRNHDPPTMRNHE